MHKRCRLNWVNRTSTQHTWQLQATTDVHVVGLNMVGVHYFVIEIKGHSRWSPCNWLFAIMLTWLSVQVVLLYVKPIPSLLESASVSVHCLIQKQRSHSAHHVMHALFNIPLHVCWWIKISQLYLHFCCYLNTSFQSYFSAYVSRIVL